MVQHPAYRQDVIRRATRYGQRFYLDLIGPVVQRDLFGNPYLMCGRDEYSDYAPTVPKSVGSCQNRDCKSVRQKFAEFIPHCNKPTFLAMCRPPKHYSIVIFPVQPLTVNTTEPGPLAPMAVLTRITIPRTLHASSAQILWHPLATVQATTVQMHKQQYSG